MRRRDFLTNLVSGATAVALGPLACGRGGSKLPPNEVSDMDASGRNAGDGKRMPVVFVGHGSPMNAVLDNAWSRGFGALRGEVPAPNAILAVSAHWFVDGTWLTGNERPRTIHDFGGFPQALYEIQYPAPGSPDLAARVRTMLGERQAGLSTDWGLDHGTWSVLKWMVPDADVPVIQLSIDRRLPAAGHLALGRSLAELREEGVLILASGNLTHNLRDAFGRMRSGDTETPGWAGRFDTDVAEAISQHDTRWLLDAWRETEIGRFSHPTPDHYLPILYAHGATEPGEPVRYPIDGFDLGSISMRAVVVG